MSKDYKMPKRTSSKEVFDKPRNIDVFEILADQHPQNVDDYAIHLYYAKNNRNPRFKVYDKRIVNEEIADLSINNKQVRINIRTGVIQERLLTN